MGKLNILGNKQKGFTYIIITVIIIIFITLLFLLFKPLPEIDNTSNNISDNYMIELNNLIKNDLNIDALNALNNGFYDFSRAHNFNVKICTIIDDKNNSIYLSNYLGDTYKELENKKTIKINKDENPNEVSLGTCYLDYNSGKTVSYYISLSNNKEKIIYKNQELSSTTTALEGLWYDYNWSYRKLIKIDHKRVEGDLNNFPIVIDLKEDTDLNAHARTDGKDIVFTDVNGNRLYREIEDYNSQLGNLITWVNTTSVSSTEDTLIYMYYGDADSNISNDTNVWDENYVLVYHLNESPEAADPAFKDSTSNDNDGTDYGTMIAADLITGKVGNAIDFDGSDDYIFLPTITDVAGDIAYTVSIWVRSYSPSETQTILDCDNWWGQAIYQISDKIRLTRYDSSYHNVDTNEVDTNNWVYITALYNTSTGMKIYKNGVLEDTNPDTSSANFNFIKYIGKRQDGNDYFSGVIDEVRLTVDNKSEDWIKTEYNNQSSTSSFYTIGAEETS